MAPILPNTTKFKSNQSPEYPTAKKKWMIYAGGAVIVLIFALINIFVFRYSQRKARETREPQLSLSLLPPTPTLESILTPTPSPTPKPIPSGKKTFSVSSGKKIGPLFRTGAIDPYDPPSGSPQTISVAVVSKKPVTTVKLTMQTDTKSKEIVMQLTNGTTMEGTWAGIWTVDDTYLYTYNATMTATDGQETNSVTLTLR